MKVDPAGKLPGLSSKPEMQKAEPANVTPPADKVEISGSAPRGATYGRFPVDTSPSSSSSEVSMVADARAQKLAEIRSRVESGAYNSREMIEKVVDRLLSSWKLGSKGSPDANA